MERKLARKELFEIIFGSPSRKCAGHGICKILRPETEKGLCRKCKKALVYLYLSENESRVNFLFPKQRLHPEILATFHDHSWFTQESKLFCSAAALGLPGRPSFILLPGKYPVIKRRHFYLISIHVEFLNAVDIHSAITVG